MSLSQRERRAVDWQVRWTGRVAMAVILAVLLILWLSGGCSLLGGGGVEMSGSDSVGMDQRGLANVGAEEVTGISIDHAMPMGLVVLLVWQQWLSHKREMTRIRGNGKERGV